MWVVITCYSSALKKKKLADAKYCTMRTCMLFWSSFALMLDKIVEDRSNSIEIRNSILVSTYRDTYLLIALRTTLTVLNWIAKWIDNHYVIFVHPNQFKVVVLCTIIVATRGPQCQVLFIGQLPLNQSSSHKTISWR